MPVGRTPPPKSQSESTLTPFGVKRKLEGDQYKYYHGPKRSFLIINSFIERSGFHPEDGTVYDEKLIPNQFREALGLKRRDEPDRQTPAGDSPLCDTIIEDDETLR